MQTSGRPGSVRARDRTTDRPKSKTGERVPPNIPAGHVAIHVFDEGRKGTIMSFYYDVTSTCLLISSRLLLYY